MKTKVYSNVIYLREEVLIHECNQICRDLWSTYFYVAMNLSSLNFTEICRCFMTPQM